MISPKTVLVLFLVAIFINGCEPEKDENESPKITNLTVDSTLVVNNSIKVLAGEIDISFTVSDDDEVESWTVTESEKGTLLSNGKGEGRLKFEVSFKFQLTKNSDLMIIVRDNKGAKTTINLNLVLNYLPEILNLQIDSIDINEQLTTPVVPGDVGIKFLAKDDSEIKYWSVKETISNTIIGEGFGEGKDSILINLIYKFITDKDISFTVVDGQDVTTTRSIKLVQDQPPVISNFKIDGLNVSDSATFTTGEISISFILRDERGLKYWYMKDLDNNFILMQVQGSGQKETSVSFVYSLQETRNILVVAKDTKNLETNLKIKIIAQEVLSFQGITLGAQSSSSGAFLDTKNGEIFNLVNAKTNSDKVDLVYFYGVTNLATLAAPNDADAATIYDGTNGLATWTKKNATKFKTTSLTTTQFANATSLSTAYNNSLGTESTKVKSLAVGSVVAFKTEAGKYGLASVTALNSGSSGHITIDVKVQK